MKFAACNHSSNAAPCRQCASSNLKCAWKMGYWILAAVRVARSIANVTMFQTTDAIFVRDVATILATILLRADHVCADYAEKFQSRMNADIVSYNQNHRLGNGLDFPTSDDWMLDSLRTGKIFPGNPFVRPCIDFGGTKKAENTRNFRNVYCKSDSHSPGFFTVQCVRKHPKLIGISVMDECEDLASFCLDSSCYRERLL